MKQSLRRLLLLVAVLQFLMPLLPAIGLGTPLSVRAVAAGVPPELPLGVFFSIWGVIFSAYLVFAILANLKPDFISDRLTGPLVLTGLGNSVWMVFAQSIGSVWLDALLLLPILLFAWEAAYRLDVAGGFDGTGRRLLACLLVGLLAGWLTVAVSISVPDVARAAFGRAPSDDVWHSLWLALIPAAGLSWLFASRVSCSIWFFIALSWGLAGIMANNWWRTETHALAIAALVVGWIIVGRRLRYGASGALPAYNKP